MKFSIQPPGGDVAVNISSHWLDQHGLAIKGWIATKAEALPEFEFAAGDVAVPVTWWHDREDIAAAQPDGAQARGFWCYLPGASPGAPVRFRARKGAFQFERAISLKPKLRKLPAWHDPAKGGGWKAFLEEANARHGSVLEIGSRQVCKGGKSKRRFFPGCAYTGFDYYKDENTDVTGDAHELSSCFTEKFDAIFSLAVFEHLAMPWVVAAEINRALKVGGITFHATHFAFPVHERPWDFWRYTDQALRVLFSPPLGFEVLRCGFDTPARMHPDTPNPILVTLPTETVWVGVSILARKVAEIDPARFVWRASVHECLGQESNYPTPG